MLITTYGTPSFVHLQLESRKRFAADCPCLIVDDASTEGEQLRQLCNEYGADFHTNESRKGHLRGDVSALVAGIRWAADSGCDLLAKFSRRFLWVANWLDWLIYRTHFQCPTFTNRCVHYCFPFRSECFAVHVGLWKGVIPLLEEDFRGMAENRLYEVAGKVPLPKQFAPPCTADVYDVFPSLTYDRHRRDESFLWHDACVVQDYQSQAISWGITQYGAADFEVAKSFT